MDLINIRKELNSTKGSTKIVFVGMPHANANLDKIDALLEDFINNHRHDFMIENVSIVRTILKDCDEKELSIFYQDENGLEFVEYDNSSLLFYEKTKEEGNRYRIKYEAQYGINLDYIKTDIDDYSSVELMSKEITEIIKQIYYLKNVKGIALDIDDKALIEMYKLFYNENPDFTNKDINIKIQTMVSILLGFNIALEGDYAFRVYKDKKMPLSLDLQQKINRLYPLGETVSILDNVRFAKEPKQIIKVVGEAIREAISSEPNQNEALINLSRVFYFGRYQLFSSSNVNTLTCQATNENESSIKLLRRIKTEIYNQVK